MSWVYPNNRYVNEQGQTTLYDVHEIERNGESTYVLSESPENRGPGFEDPRTQQVIAREACSTVMEKDGVRANDVELYQQRADSQFDKVDFRYQAAGTANESWYETNRTPTPRSELTQEVMSELHAPEKSPQEQAKQLQQDWKEMRGPEINRDVEQTAQRQTQQAFDAQEQDQAQSQKHSY